MGEPNFKNRTLYQGDNLEFLRGINTATIDLIATDPPFNKNKDFHATPDSLAAGARFEDRWAWDKDVHEEWVDAIKDNWRPVYEVIDAAKVASGMDMAAFLCWLGVRLIEMHRVLKPTGSIYLHIDHTAHAWTKTLMDAIFGRKNFRNEIVWCYAGGGQPVNDFPRKHDTILRYTKSKRFTFNRDAVRIPYDSDYAATVFAGSDTRAPGRTYKPDPRGKVVEDWWRNIPRPYGGERTGYPTQKPLELYERIIKASSNEDDVVLDPFCGCATTPVAAERLGRQWVGMDIWEGAHGVVLDRLRKEKDKNMAWNEAITHSVTPPPPNGRQRDTRARPAAGDTASSRTLAEAHTQADGQGVGLRASMGRAGCLCGLRAHIGVALHGAGPHHAQVRPGREPYPQPHSFVPSLQWDEARQFDAGRAVAVQQAQGRGLDEG